MIQHQPQQYLQSVVLTQKTMLVANSIFHIVLHQFKATVNLADMKVMVTQTDHSFNLGFDLPFGYLKDIIVQVTGLSMIIKEIHSTKY